MLRERIHKLREELRQLVHDHSEAMGEQGSNDDSNLQYHLGSALTDLQECDNYLLFATEPKEEARDDAPSVPG